MPPSPPSAYHARAGEQARMNQEETEILEALGVGDWLLADTNITKMGCGGEPSTIMHPALTFSLGAFFVANVGLLLSLPPVIMSRGAPYLPTFSKQSSIMFDRIRQNHNVAKRLREGAPLTFVDLGSGDGRLVFNAARQNMFSRCIGYEINPVLHAWACTRRLVQAPKYWASTEFTIRDLWNVNLRTVDIVAVYGLGSIMESLGEKLKSELGPGSVVVSNVFSIPGWRASSESKGGIYLYSVPECWEGGESGQQKARNAGSKA